MTVNTQPALLLPEWRFTRLARRRRGGASVVAGHSLGEYTAFVAAGTLDLEDAVRLVRFRAQAMQDAVPVGVGSMAAILGFADDEVRRRAAKLRRRSRRARRTSTRRRRS